MRCLRGNMARRRANNHWIGVVPPLAGLFLLLRLVSPQVRPGFVAYGIVVGGFLAVVVVGFIAFGVGGPATRSRRALTVEPNIDFKALSVAVAAEETQPHTTTDLIEQLRSID